MADRMLVQGARDVAQAEGVGKLAAAKGATDVANYLSKGIGEVVQARNRQFNKAMRTELNRDPSLSDEEYDALYKKLRNKRFDYVYLNKRGRIGMEKEIQKEADNMEKTKDLNNEIANTDIEDPDRDLGRCNAEAVANIVSGKMEVAYDESGNPGYNMPDGRECFAAEQEELREVVTVNDDGDAQIASYQEAWDDGRFQLSEDGKFKVDKFGNKYPNTKEGFQSFKDASEEWWRQQHEGTGKKRKLDVDTQTGERSTHAVWEKDNEDEFGSPMNMVSSPLRMTKDQGEGGGKKPPREGKGETTNKKGGANFMSLDEVKSMVKDASVDEASFQAIQGIIANSALEAESRQVGESSEFNHQSVFNNMKQQIVSKGNLRSLAQNTNPFGRTFEKDLAEAIATSSYEEMGIGSAIEDKGKLEAMDPTPKTPIDKIDAQIIVKRILEDRELLTDYVTEYYTNLAEQNFNNNLKPEVAMNFDYKLTFKEAHAAARKRFGADKNFVYRDVIYSTNTKEEKEKDEDEFAK